MWVGGGVSQGGVWACEAPSSCHAIMLHLVDSQHLAIYLTSQWVAQAGAPAGGEGGLGRELLSAVNKQQKMELPGSLFEGVGENGGRACSWLGGEVTERATSWG